MKCYYFEARKSGFSNTRHVCRPVPKSIGILLVVFPVPAALALRFQLIHFLVVLLGLFQIFDQEMIDLVIVAGFFAFRILSVFICGIGFLSCSGLFLWTA